MSIISINLHELDTTPPPQQRGSGGVSRYAPVLEQCEAHPGWVSIVLDNPGHMSACAQWLTKQGCEATTRSDKTAGTYTVWARKKTNVVTVQPQATVA